MIRTMNIGIFDTGLGGQLVARKLRKLLPEHSYIVVNDLENAPYGNKSQPEIMNLTFRAIQPIIDCDIIVIACNTATAAAIDSLRKKYPNKHFVGFEPMIKPAAQISKTSHITLLATRATKNSKRLNSLIHLHAKDLTIDMPDADTWAKSIDEGLADLIDLAEVASSVDSDSDVIILGCTHYIALEEKLKRLFPDCQVIEPTDAVSRQVKKTLSA